MTVIKVIFPPTRMTANDIQQSGIQQNDTLQNDNKSVILIYAEKAYKQQRI